MIILLQCYPLVVDLIPLIVYFLFLIIHPLDHCCGVKLLIFEVGRDQNHFAKVFRYLVDRAFQCLDSLRVVVACTLNDMVFIVCSCLIFSCCLLFLVILYGVRCCLFVVYGFSLFFCLLFIVLLVLYCLLLFVFVLYRLFVFIVVLVLYLLCEPSTQSFLACARDRL